MRQIKFRGKCTKTGEWLYGDVLRNVEGSVAIVPPFKVNMNNECNVYEVDPETVDQFTGLHDKNGKEIYEGDILQSVKYPDILINVWYDDYEASFRSTKIDCNSYKPWKTEGNICQRWLDKYPKVVIDNIHDNPELAVCRCCGTCVHFENEDVYGNGYCNVNNELKNCTSDACEKWKKNKEGGSNENSK